MTLNDSANTYEEARKLRLEENKKRFEDLGITKISKSLTVLTHSQKKPQKQRISRPRQRGILVVEPRRSTRERNPITSYVDEVDIGISFHQKRSRSRSYSSSWDSYLARPKEEVKVASCEERTAAFHAAEKLQVNLNTGNPYFVKSMLRSHVYSCFWLGLPKKFCDDHLPKSSSSVTIELEDEEGNVHDSVYLAKRTGLSGGWRGFALEKKLDDGDALVFDLVEPTRFKIYIVRVSSLDVKEKPNAKLGFKQKKKVNTGKTKEDGVDKNEGELEEGVEVKGVGSVKACAMGTRRSKRRITT